MNRSCFWGMVCILVMLPGLAHLLGENFDKVSIERLQQQVQLLASQEFLGRGYLSDRRKVADYLEGEYRKLGLKPLFPADSFRQVIPAPGLSDRERPLLGENVGGYLEGSDPELKGEFILLSAHYDHLGPLGKDRFYPGADDNAAAVAMVLEVARSLAESEQKPRRSIAFVHFDLEENLLWGSRWFAEHPPVPLKQIRLFMTADLIGRNLMDLDWPGLFVMGGENGDSLRTLLDGIPEQQGLEVHPLGADIVGTRSDYGPFRDHEVPFLFFSSGQHRDYHRPTDTPEKIDYQKLRLVTMYIGECTRRSAETGQPPKWVEKLQPEMKEVTTLLRVTEVLESQSEIVGLEEREKLFVSRFHQKLAAIEQQGTYSRKERGEVVNSARQLLLMLFTK